MTSQRDRLAAALPDVLSLALAEEIFGPGTDPLDLSHEWYMTPREMADVLIARGVRSVNAKTLERAMRQAKGKALGLVPANAPSILAALDDEANG